MLVMRVATTGAEDNTGAGGGTFASAVELKTEEGGGNIETKRDGDSKDDTTISAVSFGSSTWGFIAGPQNVGRFTIAEAATAATTTPTTKTTTAPIRTATSAGKRAPPPPPPLPSPTAPTMTPTSNAEMDDRLTAVPADVARGVEISLQTFQMTLR